MTNRTLKSGITQSLAHEIIGKFKKEKPELFEVLARDRFRDPDRYWRASVAFGFFLKDQDAFQDKINPTDYIKFFGSLGSDLREIIDKTDRFPENNQ